MIQEHLWLLVSVFKTLDCENKHNPVYLRIFVYIKVILDLFESLI